MPSDASRNYVYIVQVNLILTLNTSCLFFYIWGDEYNFCFLMNEKSNNDNYQVKILKALTFPQTKEKLKKKIPCTLVDEILLNSY